MNNTDEIALRTITRAHAFASNNTIFVNFLKRTVKKKKKKIKRRETYLYTYRIEFKLVNIFLLRLCYGYWYYLVRYTSVRKPYPTYVYTLKTRTRLSRKLSLT